MARFRMAYILAVVITVVSFIGTNSPYVLAGLVVLALMLLIGLASSYLIAASTTFELHVQPAVQVGQPLSLEMHVTRPRLMPAGRIDSNVTCHNVMRGETRVAPMVLAANKAGRMRFALPLHSSECGRVELNVESVRLHDPFSLFKRTKTLGYTTTYAVYPQLLDLAVSMERSPRASTTGVTYDPKRRGQDRTEPFEIRDYQPSDSMRSVHWKLSTKLDKLVVREASHPSNYDVLVLADLGAAHGRTGERVPDAIISGVLDLTASMSFDLRRRGLGHNVALRDGNRFADIMVDTPDSYDDMLELLVGTPMAPTMGIDVDLFQWYCRQHAFTKAVLVTGALDQTVFAELANHVDLSVVYVAQDARSTIEESSAYALVSIAADQLETRVKSVVI